MKKGNKLIKILIPILAFTGLLAVFFIPEVFAQGDFNPPSVLPGDDLAVGGYGDYCVGLANMIRTGDLSLRQIPCFIKYFSQTLIAIAGSISVIYVMIGGYRYTLSDESNEEAKKTITYALIGLAVSLMAWVLVDIVLQLATE
ncbi:hypothetical protein JXD20_03550 [Candidatus Peregrinibacteria bacterium]|nr:hypothetical protein [Candidatus Peregrinibacteria bacterium]